MIISCPQDIPSRDSGGSSLAVARSFFTSGRWIMRFPGRRWTWLENDGKMGKSMGHVMNMA